MRKKIKKGDSFICIKKVKMDDDDRIEYRKGFVYNSENNNCITDIGGDKDHSWTKYNKETKKYFLRIKTK